MVINMWNNVLPLISFVLSYFITIYVWLYLVSCYFEQNMHTKIHYKCVIIGVEKNITTVEEIIIIATDKSEKINVYFVNSICQVLSFNGELNKTLYLLNFI